MVGLATSRRENNARAGLGPRRRARSATIDAFKTPAVIGVSIGLTTALVLIVMASDAWGRYTGHTQSRYLSGAVLGASLASAAWAMWNAVTLTDGSWSWRIGALAETWT